MTATEHRERAAPGDVSGWGLAVLAVVASGLLVAGWWLFWFLTDDAFIAFRYVSNAMAGRGLVWNPPPFLPVEGYTSFLWVMVLLGVWKLIGVAPPESANVLSLLFGAGTVALAGLLVLRIRLPPRWRGYRLALLAAALAGILLNRTFLTWLSSGLETALFNFLLIAWIVLAVERWPRRRGLQGVLLSTAAALSALARPDGLLVVLATPAVLALQARTGEGEAAVRDRGGVSWRAVLVRALPLGAVGVHLLWRRWFYGFWLPNTHAAKVVEPWPEAGLRYAASFVVENGVWLWIVLAAVAAVRRWRRGGAASDAQKRVAVVSLVLAAHAGYYLGVVGGDHFEYRVLSHLVPLLFISAVALLPRVTSGPGAGLVLLVALVAVSLPIPWLHWDETRHLSTRDETFQLAAPVAHRFPPPLDRAVARWDRWQAWLQARSVCARRKEHEVFFQSHRRRLPSREEGARIGWEDRPVVAAGGVGLIGWVLPNVAVIDVYGLNDRVIARTPVPPEAAEARRMGHDRRPPPGYVECFRPNVRAAGPRVAPRRVPLTDADIAACERRRWPP